jgi:hypothetical protein
MAPFSQLSMADPVAPSPKAAVAPIPDIKTARIDPKRIISSDPKKALNIQIADGWPENDLAGLLHLYDSPAKKLALGDVEIAHLV